MKKNILVIDDSPFIKKQINEILKGLNYTVIGYAKTGEKGVELFKECHPDIVILDIIMPGIDGIETASNLLEVNPKAKIIMLSSLCGIDMLEEVRKMGIKYLLPKPIEDKLLIATLELLYR